MYLFKANKALNIFYNFFFKLNNKLLLIVKDTVQIIRFGCIFYLQMINFNNIFEESLLF